MKIRKCVVVLLCFFCLCGCENGMGSFEHEDIQLSKLCDNINQKSIDHDWEYPIMEQQSLSLSQIADRYHMDMMKIKDCEVRVSLLQAQLGELMFFHVEKNQDAYIKQIVQKHIAQLKQDWKEYLLEADTILNNVKEGRIKEYYYVIIGSDAQKVVNYIQNMK